MRPHSWAKEWSRLGHEVTVLTMEHDQEPSVSLKFRMEGWRTLRVPVPKFVHRLRSSYRRSGVSSSEHQSLQHSIIPRLLTDVKRVCVRAFQGLRQRFGIFSSCRMPDFTDLWVRRALQYVEGEPSWDLVVSTSGPYATHLVAYSLRKRGRAKYWIADYRDLWCQNPAFPGIFPFNSFEKFIEKRVMKLADQLTTVSQPLARNLAALHGRRQVYVIENGFDRDDLAEIPAEPIFDEDGKYRIVYTGSIYPGKTDPALLFETIKMMSQDVTGKGLLENLEVIFIGLNHPGLQDQIDNYGVGAWVKRSGFVARETSLRMQRDAHALLFLSWKDENVDGILTGKIFEYLFSGTPLITLGSQKSSADRDLISKSGAGKYFYETTALKDYLTKVLMKPRKEGVAVASEFLANYERKKLARDMLEICKKNDFR